MTQERRKWVRRDVDFLVHLVYPTRGIREVHLAAFRLLTISEGGASIYVGTTKSLPDFFYIQFDDELSELTGCYLVERDDDVLRCHFDPALTTMRLDDIIARKTMTSSLLDKLFDPSDDLIGELTSLIQSP